MGCEVGDGRWEVGGGWEWEWSVSVAFSVPRWKAHMVKSSRACRQLCFLMVLLSLGRNTINGEGKCISFPIIWKERMDRDATKAQGSFPGKATPNDNNNQGKNPPSTTYTTTEGTSDSVYTSSTTSTSQRIYFSFQGPSRSLIYFNPPQLPAV